MYLSAIGQVPERSRSTEGTSGERRVGGKCEIEEWRTQVAVDKRQNTDKTPQLITSYKRESLDVTNIRKPINARKDRETTPSENHQVMKLAQSTLEIRTSEGATKEPRDPPDGL